MPTTLIDIVRSEGEGRLRAYFTPGEYTGRWFETFAGGGDRAAVRDTITVDDLYAVESLNVRVPFAVGKALLDGELGTEVSGHLRKISGDVELGRAHASELVADGGPAERAWQLLADQTDVGWVIAGKLLARKRPKLIPVYDSIVSCQYGAPKQVWRKLDGHLRADGGALRAELDRVRAAADVHDQVSALRALDVVLWMRHVKGHWRADPRRCPRRHCVQF